MDVSILIVIFIFFYYLELQLEGMFSESARKHGIVTANMLPSLVAGLGIPNSLLVGG
jgi:hypothetical protein